jgi:hypothetical protein
MMNERCCRKCVGHPTVITIRVLCAKARAELVMLWQKTQRPDARRAQPLEVSLQGDLEFEQILHDNLLGPPVRPSQASAHCNRSE